MGKPSRDKGQREERAIVNGWQLHGFCSERIPLSGAAGGSFTGDVTIPITGVDRIFEVKVRANGFREIYGWLADHFGLFIRSDRNDRLVVLREADFRELCRVAELHKDEVPNAA